MMKNLNLKDTLTEDYSMIAAWLLMDKKSEKPVLKEYHNIMPNNFS